MLNLATEPFSTFINIPARLDTFWKFSIYHSFSMFLLSIPSAWNVHCHFTTQRGCILSPLLSRFIRRCKQPAALKRNTRFREKLPFILPRIEKNTYALKSHEHFWKDRAALGTLGRNAETRVGPNTVNRETAIFCAEKNEFFHQNGKGTFGTPLGPLEWLAFVQIQFFTCSTISIGMMLYPNRKLTGHSVNSPTSNVWCVHDIREFQNRATTEDSLVSVSRSSWIVWPNKASELWAAWRCQYH